MVKKARAAGQFLGGILNNPAVVILGGLAIVLLIFRGNISQAFADLGKSISGGLGDINIQLPEISLPSFPEISFPELPSFPEITFPELPSFPEITFPDFSNLFGGGAVTPPEQDPAGAPDLSIGLAGGIQERRRAQQEAAALAAIPERDIQDAILGDLTPAQKFAFIERGVIPTGFEVIGGELVAISQMVSGAAAVQPNDLDFGVQSFLQEPQQFTGGGVSFMGGSVSPTPTEFLSLSQIIDQFGVTASQAANLRAIAQGFTPEEEQFLQGSGDVIGFTGFNPPAVSDQQFAGLTPEEIALRLTGGNISNF